VIIALFTPDEHASFYDPETGSYEGGKPGESRWQARPNVIFEAGVALGAAREKMILVTIGSDVQLFSDVSGVHFVRLDSPTGPADLLARIQRLLPGHRMNSDMTRAAQDFSRVIRTRWEFYDELHELRRQLQSRQLRPDGPSLLEVVTRTALVDITIDWPRMRPRDFMTRVKILYSPGVTDTAYWWLVVYGFFAFRGIEQWFQGRDPTYNESVDFTDFTPRALAFLAQIVGLRR
jgi:hypothetical protein